ncbi:phosphoenolpyruvate--protein phosphotransferase [Pseudogracilibacillus auburnensis]|uniref:phosphoenolpyruvate--protein phosphotransferase n=1 Tax=Pseudogracilibacillus auburnensis TaxID=1494959 RepID=UPI001A95844E|nr:phosphoenolpyruvate--protein phosphotransferase [Pseudogracilibacillus auburnensis]MBO1002537.1 phosphoenolpyruvate--protein phosphotransferase [Pseudogracilibacillus auburnensis]
MPVSLHGIAASNGYAFGKAYKLIEPDLSFEKTTIENSDEEIQRFHEAIKNAKKELAKIREKVTNEQGEVNAAIFDAHLLVLDDPELISTIENKINEEKVNAESALRETTDTYIQMFEQLENEYMRERAADIKDVTKRVLAHLLGETLPNPGLIAEETILIAVDLTPSDTAQINKQFVKGFVTDIGGRTSHSAIMARSLGIPAIVGTKTISSTIQQGDNLIIDGMNGEVIIHPTDEVQEKYKEKMTEFQAQQAEWALLKDEPTISHDDHKVELAANIGSPQDVESAINNGAEGIGLYRTEFLYMESTSLPTEEEQFQAYKVVLQGMNGKPVIVRTLDIGGDKQLPYLELPEEMNPFLGLRAIRLAFEKIDVFRTQLRALLRASTFGHVKIMFPMIATLDEFRKAKAILLEEKEKLTDEGISVSENIEVGIMVEIPSTAILADEFAKEVDFFSIGTNDLIQYTFAADRMNESVAYLYQPYHPAILRLVKLVIDAAHKEGKWAGMCGEMAGDPNAIPLLLGLGLDEFSMSASSILQARSQIKQLDQKAMRKLAEKALQLQTSEDVKKLLETEVKATK